MSIPFKLITLEDKDVITSFTLNSNYRNCDFSFSNICSWRFLYDSEFAVVDNMLLIRFRIEDKTRLSYMMPVGTGDIKQAVLSLEKDAAENGQPLLLLGVYPDTSDILEQIYPEGFEYMTNRDYFDYIYLREDLAQLKGKKYQSKRNHINNFKKQYEYKYMPITPKIVPLCLELENKWYKTNHTEEDKEELSNERRSMTYALNHYEELNLRGGAICVDNQIIAFSFGTAINHETFGVHVEKADINYDGAYAAINQAFASHLPEEYIYINREEDLGLPGLRQAKQSYQPVLLLEKGMAIRK